MNQLNFTKRIIMRILTPCVDRRILILMAYCAVAGGLLAQPSDRCYQLYGGLTTNLVPSQLMKTSVYPTMGIRIGVNTQPETSSPYAAWYGYPTLGIDIGWQGLEHMHYRDGSHLDNIVTISGFIERGIVRRQQWSVDYGLNLGMGFNSATYDPVRNPLNIHFSSPLLIYVGGQLMYKYRPSEHWEFGAALRLEHFSTGRLAYPNTGLNLARLDLSVRYNLIPVYFAATDKPRINYRHIFAEVSVGGGLHRCATEWRVFGSTSPWPNYTQQLALFWRYTPTMSTGIGLDAVFAKQEFLDRVQEAERVLYGDAVVSAYGAYDPLSIGIALTQQFHYDNFVLFGAFGYYQHRHLGLHEQEGRFYQKAGVKLYIPRLGGLFLSADCLAHGFSRAAMIEFSIGYRIAANR